ncbi:nuclear pore glycoprotein p62 isoform X2 [Schistocerca cancellata]|uniref:nuclear pore glycoprotein p62 isoform X2 n=1 Tax=Schistocerca cancellata TaxID=274614 RepID=UPI002118BF3A|nr:nuclear pore glycoprotein p62 isoform X2 [Schistocerca cancellata]
MNFTFGTPVSKPATGFTLSLPAASTGLTLTPKTTATTSTAAASGTTAPAGTSTVATTTAATGFSLPSTAASGFSLISSAATSTATGTAPTTIQAIAISSSVQAGLGATTVVSSAAGTTSSLNFTQLEENINKWTLELEEQEKVFMNQVVQINAWDRMLISNAEKIVNLNSAVEQVKLEQQQLEHELDFIVAQQRELEECLVPLEKELENTITTGIDPERERTYDLAENLDSQLKQMSEDLKELIDLLNEMNRSGKDSNDPFVQIGRILNAHMNSLQWIDENTTQLATQIEQVSKLHDILKRENERSFHLTYDKDY